MRNIIERLREQTEKPGTAHRDVTNTLHEETIEEIAKLRSLLKTSAMFIDRYESCLSG